MSGHESVPKRIVCSDLQEIAVRLHIAMSKDAEIAERIAMVSPQAMHRFREVTNDLLYRAELSGLVEFFDTVIICDVAGQDLLTMPVRRP